MAYRFEEIEVGQAAELAHTISEADVAAFAALTGDNNPLHVDAAFARRTPFQTPVAHGMLSASFLSTLIGTVLPGGGALWSSQTLEFHAPARVGDTLRVRAVVKQKSPATRSIVLDVEITNQHGRRLVSGESIVKVLEVREEGAMPEQTRPPVVVTGAGGGIGAAVARKLAAEGHAVVRNYHGTIEATEGDARVLAVQADITNAEEVARLFATAREAFGPVGAVVHCAGLGSALRRFDELDWAQFARQIDVHVKGAMLCARAALPMMLELQYGALVFLGSIAAEDVPPPQQADYVVAKAALAALARSLAVEYGPQGIRVNVVAPGMTNTGMIAALPEKARLLAKMQAPLRRLGEPEDIAEVVAFLLGPGGRHLTGQTLRVCGGAVMG